MKIFITVDLGFGDAGKGTIVDALVRRYRAGLIVRYCGGSQCAHSVYSLEGVHHSFSQFGSTFVPGTATLCSRYMLVNPLTMVAEAEILAKKGVTDALNRVYIDSRALVITPYHRAVNRLRELARAGGKHGSCGQGIGETQADFNEVGFDALRMGDMLTFSIFVTKLWAARDRMRFKANQIEGLPDTLEVSKQLSTWDYDLDRLLNRYQDFIAVVGPHIVDPYFVATLFSKSDCVVFEGAQGVLLDESYGFHPYTTWSTTTTRNAKLMLEEAEITTAPVTIGVTRSYQTRHGAGPFPTEDQLMTKNLADLNNPRNDWQDHLRSGALDLVLMRYAHYVTGRVDMLAVTHMDKVTDNWPLCLDYTAPDLLPLKAAVPRNLEEQAAFCKWLYTVKPVLTHGSKAGFIAELQDRMGIPVGISSYGPCPNDKHYYGQFANVVDEAV